MLHQTRELTGDDLRVLDELAAMREELKHQIASPRKWTGLLRRSLTAAAIAGSNSIEGIRVGQPDAEAAVAGEEPTETDADTWSDVLGYRDALTYVQAAKLWSALVDVAESEHLPERTVTALYEAMRGGAVRRTMYQRDEDLSNDQAARDLRTLTDRGLLAARGETKGRRYEATSRLRNLASHGSRAQGGQASLREPYDFRVVPRS